MLLILPEANWNSTLTFNSKKVRTSLSPALLPAPRKKKSYHNQKCSWQPKNQSCQLHLYLEGVDRDLCAGLWNSTTFLVFCYLLYKYFRVHLLCLAQVVKLVIVARSTRIESSKERKKNWEKKKTNHKWTKNSKAIQHKHIYWQTLHDMGWIEASYNAEVFLVWWVEAMSVLLHCLSY